ncbi:MAG TPA: hypothetical protein PL143_08810 [Rhodocyclaceae bacterium]|nr:hypothetical protein [Rhodocyclaceae bacterium]
MVMALKRERVAGPLAAARSPERSAPLQADARRIGRRWCSSVRVTRMTAFQSDLPNRRRYATQC